MATITRQVERIDDRESWLAKRAGFLGASEIAACFNTHPYLTALQLWGEKCGMIEAEEMDSQAARRGRLFEGAVACALREDHPDWVINAARDYCMLPDERLAATPDFYGVDQSGHTFVIQAKIVTPDSFESEWREAPPTHYLMQLQAEMLCTGLSEGVLAPLVFDHWKFPVYAYRFKADREFQQRILAVAKFFWKAVDQRREPRLTFPQDRETLAKLFPEGAEDPVLNLGGRDDLAAMCERREQISRTIKTLEEEKTTLDGKLANEMRNHARAEIPGQWRINWPSVAASSYTVERKAHRRFSVSRIKAKQ